MKHLFLTWFGQSGFIIRSRETTIACDLYLSDYCRKKSRLDHTRLMPIPVEPESLNNIDHYLITHSHIDHFDPETIGPILAAGPKTRFYCPPEASRIVNEHFPEYENRFHRLKSFQKYKLRDDISLIALPAAHEELEKDSDGEYIAFSYLTLFDDLKKAVFFAGDTIPFTGQAEMIRKHVPDNYELVLVLPVNGRDAERAALGFKGNLTLAEAVSLYHGCKADLLIPCHFGMFELNNAKEEISERVFRETRCKAAVPEVMKGILI
ncbi:MAG: MBL fold metallo-hydrolase [Victivallales bacterium]